MPLHLAGHAAETEGGAGQAWIGGGPELLGSTFRAPNGFFLRENLAGKPPGCQVGPEGSRCSRKKPLY